MNSFDDGSLLLNVSAPLTKNTIPTHNKVQIKKQKYQRKLKSTSIDPKHQIRQKTISMEKPKGKRMEQSQQKNHKHQQNKIRTNKPSKPKTKTQNKSTVVTLPTKSIKVDEILPDQENKQKYIDKHSLQQFELEPKLKNSLQEKGIQRLTEIQQQCFESLTNKRDSIIKARTGSGKTLAYLIPLINNYIREKLVTERGNGIVLMVVCPTRQLCVQAQKQAERCLKRCPFIVGGCLMGGEDINHEKARIRKGINILFCTPGKLLYHLQKTQRFTINNLGTIVFEEADRTLDLGFQETTTKIIQIIQSKLQMAYIHKILVSAHFNSKVSSLIERLSMNEPQFLGFQAEMSLSHLEKEKDEEINASSQLKQQYVLISEGEKIPFMLSYVGLIKQSKVMIFVSTIDEVEFLDCLLCNIKFKDANGIETDIRLEDRPIFKIHGDLDQKLRSNTYLQFRKAKEAIMISTEVASRGLDFPDVSHIILFDVPPSITDYGNRVGRSARFNRTGVSLLLLHYQQSDYAEKIRYFCPDLQLLERENIYENYRKILQSMNIGDKSLHYIEGLIRSLVKDDEQKYQVARKAYVSMLRAYSRLKQKTIFTTKKLNLKMLARTFGLNSANAENSYNPKAKVSQMETSRKKRKVESVKHLQFSQYM